MRLPQLWRNRSSRISARNRRHTLLNSLRFEPLEERNLLTTFIWDAGGNGTSWSDPANWDVGGANPAAAPGLTDGQTDNVIIDAGGTFTVTLDVDIVDDASGDALGSLNLNAGGATLLVNGRTLTVDGPSTIADGLVDWRSSQWAGTGTLTNQDTIHVTGASSITTAGFNQDGTLRVLANFNAHASLTVDNGFANTGTFVLDNLSNSGLGGATLVVGSGGLTNSGIVRIEPGAGGRTIRADVVNNGDVDLQSTLLFDKDSGLFTNNDQVTIGAGHSFTLSGNGTTFTQAAGTLDVQGSFLSNDDSFTLVGGDLSGNAISLTSSTLNLSPATATTGDFRFGGLGNTITGGTAVNQRVFVEANFNAHATLTSNGDFVNKGIVTLDNLANSGFGNATFIVTGTLTNALSGTIVSSLGAGGRLLSANVINDGTVNVEDSLLLSRHLGTFTNNNLVDVAGGATLNLSGDDATFVQQSGALNLTFVDDNNPVNDGGFVTNNDTVNFNGGNIQGNALQLRTSSLNIGVGSIGAGSFRFAGLGNSLSGDIAENQKVSIESNFNDHASLIAATAFANHGDIELDNLANSGFGAATLQLTNGLLTNSTTGTITMSPGAGARNLDADVDNHGQVLVNQSAALTKEAGVFTNHNLVEVAVNQTLSLGGNDASYTQEAGSTVVNGAFTTNDDTVNFNDGNFQGNALQLRTSNLNIGVGSTGTGSFRFAGRSNTLSGDIAENQSVSIESNFNDHASLIAAAAFANHGDIELDNLANSGLGAATLQLTNGVLTNSATGTITMSPGAGARNLDADVDNHGLVLVNQSASLTKDAGVFTNHSLVDVAVNQTLTLGGNDFSYTQETGSTIVNGAFTTNDDTVNFNGGDFTINAPVLTTSSLNIGGGSTGEGSFRFRGLGNALSGDVAVNQNLFIEANFNAHASLIATASATNHGGIELDNLANSGFGSATLQLTNGVLTNSATGTITAAFGAGARTLDANVSNSGTVNVNDASLTLSKDNGSFENNGSVNVAATRALSITGSMVEFTQSGGTLDVAGIFSMDGDTFSFTGGSIVGGGDLFLTSSDVQGVGTAAVDIHAAGATIDIGTSPGVLNVDIDTVTATGGTHTQNSGSLLNIEIGGPTPGIDQDQLNITGNADISGTLNIAFVDGFVPHACQAFTVITHGSRSGALPTVNVTGLPAGFSARVDFESKEVNVVVYNNGEPINVNPSGLALHETGGFETYEVCLATSTPLATNDVVVLDITPDSELNVDAVQLIFDSGNWKDSQTVTVTAEDDADVEGAHAGLVTHSSSSNLVAFDNVLVPSVAATIDDNDIATVFFSSSHSSVDEGPGAHNIGVTLNIPSGGVLEQTVSVDVVDALTGTASSGADYTLVSQTVFFGSGDVDGTTLNAILDTLEDANVEGAETVVSELTNLIDGTGGQVTIVTPQSHTTTIQDNDNATIAFAAATSVIDEDDPAGSLDVGVTLTIADSGVLEQPVSVDVVDLLSGSAATPQDYGFATPQLLTFGVGTGSSSQSVTLTLVNDDLSEGDENVLFDLTNLQDGTAGQVSFASPHDHTVTILDDDQAEVAFLTITSNVAESISTHTVTVRVDVPGGGPLTQPLSVKVTDLGTGSADDSAIDYSFFSPMFTFDAGTPDGSIETVDISIVNDVTVESDETIALALTDVSGGILGTQSHHEVTIGDNDTAFFTIDDATVNEGDGTLTLVVHVSNPIDIGVMLDASYQNGTAVGSAGGVAADFDNDADTVWFPANTTAPQSIVVAITDDLLDEVDESFTAHLAVSTDLDGRSSNTDDIATATIVDNDDAGGNELPIILSLSNSSPGCGGSWHGDTISLVARFTDPDNGDTHTATIDWGDGAITNGAVDSSTGTVSGEHTYDKGGIYQIQVTISDGTDAAQATNEAVISGVRLTDDGILQIVGTDQKDRVTIGGRNGGSDGGHDQLRVHAKLGGRHERLRIDDPSQVTSIFALLCDGNDKFQISHSGGGSDAGSDGGSDGHSDGGFDLTIPATVVGGKGNDHLKGGNAGDILLGGKGRDHLQGFGGGDVLIGGAGRDKLNGGRGRDVLIGGTGKDHLKGGKEDDLLIGGTTSFDEDIAALQLILVEWESPQSYADRIEHLREGTGTLTGTNIRLVSTGPDQTVFDDGVRDKLKGDKGRDWFFADLDCQDKDDDRICDLRTNEIVDLLTV